MVAAVENLTRVEGTITRRAPHPELRGWDLVTLSVDRTESVPGKADLLSGRAGHSLEIAVRRELLDHAGEGWHLSARVRVTPAGPMAEPQPDASDWRLAAP